MRSRLPPWFGNSSAEIVFIGKQIQSILIYEETVAFAAVSFFVSPVSDCKTQP